MADTLYSATLLVAIVVSITVAAWSLLELVRGRRQAVSFVSWSGVAAAVAATVSWLVHLRFGHGGSSLEPMTVPVFIRNHPAYLAVAAALTCAAVCRYVTSRRPPR